MSPGQVTAIRVGAAVAVFAAMALWEWLAPRRALTAGRRPRWPGNLGIWAIDSVVVRLSAPRPWSAWRSPRPSTAGGCFICSACRIGPRWFWG